MLQEISVIAENQINIIDPVRNFKKIQGVIAQN